MATCNPETLLENGSNLQGLTPRQLDVLKCQLLCEISSSPNYVGSYSTASLPSGSIGNLAFATDAKEPTRWNDGAFVRHNGTSWEYVTAPNVSPTTSFALLTYAMYKNGQLVRSSGENHIVALANVNAMKYFKLTLADSPYLRPEYSSTLGRIATKIGKIGDDDDASFMVYPQAGDISYNNNTARDGTSVSSTRSIIGMWHFNASAMVTTGGASLTIGFGTDTTKLSFLDTGVRILWSNAGTMNLVWDVGGGLDLSALSPTPDTAEHIIVMEYKNTGVLHIVYDGTTIYNANPDSGSGVLTTAIPLMGFLGAYLPTDQIVAYIAEAATIVLY